MNTQEYASASTNPAGVKILRGASGIQTRDPVQQWRFLETEVSLSARLGAQLAHPVRLFDVDGLGVSFDRLQRSVGPSFHQLPWDEYDARRERVEFLMRRFSHAEQSLREFLPRYFTGERGLEDLRPLIDALSDDERARFDRIRPYRRRAIATFIVRKSGRHPLAWEIERRPDASFTQAKDHHGDYRGLERRFAPSPPEVTGAPEYLELIRRIAALTNIVRGGSLTTMRVVCHQMGLVARHSAGVTNAPEGIHQDGADYIVSALVIERRNVEGGESVVFGPDKRTEYLRRTLVDGQGIFQADAGSPLWHWATPVRPTGSASEDGAFRNILGYDVHLD